MPGKMPSSTLLPGMAANWSGGRASPIEIDDCQFLRARGIQSEGLAYLRLSSSWAASTQEGLAATASASAWVWSKALRMRRCVSESPPMSIPSRDSVASNSPAWALPESPDLKNTSKVSTPAPRVDSRSSTLAWCLR